MNPEARTGMTAEWPNAQHTRLPSAFFGCRICFVDGLGVFYQQRTQCSSGHRSSRKYDSANVVLVCFETRVSSQDCTSTVPALYQDCTRTVPGLHAKWMGEHMLPRPCEMGVQKEHEKETPIHSHPGLHALRHVALLTVDLLRASGPHHGHTN